MKYYEDAFQRSVARFLDYQPGVLWCHVANERLTSKKSGGNLKLKGVKPGVPDVLIFEPNDEYHGLFIELKIKQFRGYKKDGSPRALQKSKITDAQKKYLNDLHKRGYKVAIVYNMDEFLQVYDDYFKTVSR